jgi:hypothetical protein
MKTKNFLLNAAAIDNSLDSEKTLVFSFFNNPEDASTVKKKFPLSTVIGCSSSGSILDRNVIDQQTVISVLQLESASFKKIVIPFKDVSESFAIGQRIGVKLNTSDLKGILILADGLNINGSNLSKGISDQLGDSKVVVCGGMAGDGFEFKNTYTLNEEKVSQNQVIAIGFYGPINIFSSYKGGWKNFGPVRKVTKSIDNKLVELDNCPALDIYKEYLGKKSEELPGSALFYPLSITNEEGTTLQCVRTILSVNDTEKTLTFAGNIPNNSYVRLMYSTQQSLLEAAKGAAESINNLIDTEKNVFTMAISCVGRRIVLDEYSPDELASIFSGIPSLKNIIGFYSYGEFSKGLNQVCDLHNQTMTLIAIQEE